MLCERPRDGSWAGEKILSPDLKGSLRRALPFEAGPVNGICWSMAANGAFGVFWDIAAIRGGPVDGCFRRNKTLPL